jgi:hypothetical protein
LSTAKKSTSNKEQLTAIVLLAVIASLLFISTIAVYAQSGQDSLHVKDFPDLQLVKNTNYKISLKADASGNLTKVPLNFSVEEGPSHGVTGNAIPITHNGTTAMIIYTPQENYTGPDAFTFKATAFNTTHSSNIAKASITVNPLKSKLVYVAPPEYRAGLAFGISLVIVLLIFVIAYIVVVRRIRMRQTKKIKPRFWDIIRDDNWYPSLAIFQFLLWTGIVLFAYFGIALTRLFSGVGVFIDIPYNLILVMGISAAVPLVGAVVSDFKYAGTTPPGIFPTKEVPSDQIRKRLPGFKTMLMENDKLTLPRFQMFAWTWIGIMAYLGLLFLEVVKLGSFENLVLPVLPILFISLMGLSQVTYLTAKSVKPSFFSINEVRPERIRLQEMNNAVNNLTILGSNFGNKGTVWVEYYPPVTENEKNRYCTPLSKKEKERMKKEDVDVYEKEWADEFRYYRTRLEEQFDVTPKTPDWEDNRIVVSLDSIKDKLKHQKYVLRVEKDGLLTYANSDAAFEISPTPVQLNPADGSTNVPIYSSITAKFDEPMRISTFILRDSCNHEVPGTVNSDGITATFKQTKNFFYNSQYTATITGVTDETEDPMLFEKTWSFKTQQPLPTVTPTQVTTQVTPTQVTTQVTPTQVTATQVTPTQVTATQVTPTQVTPTQVTATQVTPTQVTATQVTPTQVTATQVTPTQVTATQVTPTQVTPTQVTATQVTATQVTPTQVTATQVTPTQVTPTQVTATQVTLINKELGKITSENDKIRVGVGIIFFNDYSSLKRCINSIIVGADIIFAIDGKFPTFPGDSQFSTDGSRELVKSYAKCLLLDCPRPEFEKREKYLEYCALYSVDILLIVDSDEFVLNGHGWETFHRNLKTVIFDRDKCVYNVYSVMLQSLANSQVFAPYPRIWYNPAQMEYYSGRHYCFRNKDVKKTNISNQSESTSTVIQGIELGHDHSLRSKHHLESRSIYQTWLVNFERSLSQ